MKSLADEGGARDPPGGGVKILSISCSFWGNLAKSYVGPPPPPTPGELAPPPRGNPGSATGNVSTLLRISICGSKINLVEAQLVRKHLVFLQKSVLKEKALARS